MSAVAKSMWEPFIVRGIAGILFGIAAVFWPGLTLATLVYIFSIYILFSGVVSMVEAVMSLARGNSWFVKLILSIVEIGVGLFLVRRPFVTFATFVLVAGFVLIARGVMEVVSALIDDEAATYKMLMIIGGLLSAVVGVIVLLQPAASGVAFVWLLGLYALITGPILIAMGLDIKKAVK